MARAAGKRDIDDSLAIRAAWLHYAAGLTQAEVAARLGVPSVKAHRLIAWANQSGAVKVTIDGDVTECFALGARIAERYGLLDCEVVPDLHEDGLPLRALGIAGAGFLRRAIEERDGGVIGIGNGRTLAAAITAMPQMQAGATRFVSLLGGLTRNYAANPHDVMYRLAEKTGAEAYSMPVPLFANTAADRAVLLAQRGVSEVFDLVARADLLVVGIGTAQPDAVLVAARMIDMEEIREVQALGGVGEMLGQFFDREGRPTESSLTARTIAPSMASLKGRRIVAIAGGRGKIEGIRSVLKSGCLTKLITDERTALALTAGDTF